MPGPAPRLCPLGLRARQWNDGHGSSRDEPMTVSAIDRSLRRTVMCRGAPQSRLFRRRVRRRARHRLGVAVRRQHRLPRRRLDQPADLVALAGGAPARAHRHGARAILLVPGLATLWTAWQKFSTRCRRHRCRSRLPASARSRSISPAPCCWPAIAITGQLDQGGVPVGAQRRAGQRRNRRRRARHRLVLSAWPDLERRARHRRNQCRCGARSLGGGDGGRRAGRQQAVRPMAAVQRSRSSYSHRRRPQLRSRARRPSAQASASCSVMTPDLGTNRRKDSIAGAQKSAVPTSART